MKEQLAAQLQTREQEIQQLQDKNRQVLTEVMEQLAAQLQTRKQEIQQLQDKNRQV